MLILGLESSATAGSCALCDVEKNNTKIIAHSFIGIKQTHSVTLMPMIENMLKNVGIGFDKLEAIATASGPGSFTGVRIGIASAKGLSSALNIPCIGVSSLHAISAGFIGFEAIICAVMDARRNQFYNAIFSVKGDKIERLSPDRAISCEDLEKELFEIQKSLLKKTDIILAGDGAELAFSLMRSDNLCLAPAHLRFPSAYAVCGISLEYPLVSADELIPLYLRRPQAERERLEKQKSL